VGQRRRGGGHQSRPTTWPRRRRVGHARKKKKKFFFSSTTKRYGPGWVGHWAGLDGLRRLGCGQVGFLSFFLFLSFLFLVSAIIHNSNLLLCFAGFEFRVLLKQF
jgi:hypothetical protein